MKNQKAIVINNNFMCRQLFDHFFKSETKYPLDDFWWVFSKFYPNTKKAKVQAIGNFPYHFLVIYETEDQDHWDLRT